MTEHCGECVNFKPKQVAPVIGKHLVTIRLKDRHGYTVALYGPFVVMDGGSVSVEVVE